jgi:cystathionine gamma-synthase
MSSPEAWHPATRLAQALGRIDERSGAVVPAIEPASTYLRDHTPGRIYARADNPTFEAVEQLLTDLEGGTGSLLFASGMAAATAVFQASAPGDHILMPRVMYWALRNWALEHGRRWGLDIELVDTTDLAALARAIRPRSTRLVWIETPANPMWDITDIAGAAEIAHRAGARLTVDSTGATPLLTRPLELGADIVMHSATKYLNGHSDLIAGTLTTRVADECWSRIVGIRAQHGAILGSFEAWLLLRGMRTLALRVREACRSAQRIAERFEGHARVAEVLYPGLPGFPGHDVAARQMEGGFGGMLSIRVTGDARAVARRTKIWKEATSLGGVESLIEHRASIEGPTSPVPDDLLRLSVGIEAVEDLIADLEQALAA